MDIEIVYLLLAGLCGGFLAGLLGIGGGVIYILILQSALSNAGVCDEEIVSYTIANSLFAIFIASASGNIKSILNRNIDYREVLLIGIISSVIAILGMTYVVNTDWYSKQMFNLVVVILLVFMLLKMLLKTKMESKEEAFHLPKHSFIALISGLTSALSGLGGGIIVVPLLQNLFHMNIKKAKNISLGTMGVMAFIMSAFNLFDTNHCQSNELQTGLIVFPIVLVISLGVAIASPLGVKFSEKISDKNLKLIFGLLIVVVIIRKMLEILS